MKKKNIKLAVNCFFDRKCYQVALTKQEEKLVLHLISEMHDNKIKIIKEELPLKLKWKY